MLNSVEWEYFKLEDLFEIKRGKSAPMKNQEEGNIPLVSSTEQNNGVSRFVKNNKENILFNKNSITLAINGSVGECFYQPYNFYATGDVAVLKGLYANMNKYIYLFIITILKIEKIRYSYGRKWTMARIKNTSIKLPIDSNGDPNWKFMEDYIKNLSEGSLEEYSLPKNNIKLSLDDREWDDFKLEDLFEVERGKRLIKKDRIDGDIPYMSASERNNGITDKISNPLFVKKKSLCLTTFGDAFYHEKEFTASDEITILKNEHLNNYIGLFMVGILQHQKYRYSFGRKLYYNKIKHITIKLPIKPKASPDEKSEPDWKFMEDYIKGLPYTNKL